MFFKVIAVDFDGTLCENRWPAVGEPNNEVITYLKDQQSQGVKAVLWTCRTGVQLEAAIEWCKDHGLEFDAVNENIPEAIELFGEDTRKIFAEEYIDDKASTRFKLPFAGENCDTHCFTDVDMKIIETFISKNEPVMEIWEVQALAKMQCDIYRRLMTPTHIITNNYSEGERR